MNNDVVVSVSENNDGMCLPNDKVCVVNLTSTAAVFQNPTAADHSTTDPDADRTRGCPAHTQLNMWFMGTLHRHNDVYILQTVYLNIHITQNVMLIPLVNIIKNESALLILLIFHKKMAKI